MPISTHSSTMDFGGALCAIKRGERVARLGWNGKGLSVQIQRPDDYSKMTLPYFFLNYPPADATTDVPSARVPWVPSVSDVLAEDWVVVY